MAEEQLPIYLPDDLRLPDFVRWPTFPFEGQFRVRPLQPSAGEEPPRQGEGGVDCAKCAAPDSEYLWADERWRVRALGRPSGLPAVVVLETRGHYDLGDLSNLLAAELGVMTVRLERGIRSLPNVVRVHVNRWGDGSEHLHVFFLARPKGFLQLRGTFLSMWDDILPPIPDHEWRENLTFIAAWMSEYSGEAVAPPPTEWAPSGQGGAHQGREPVRPAAEESGRSVAASEPPRPVRRGPRPAPH